MFKDLISSHEYSCKNSCIVYSSDIKFGLLSEILHCVTVLFRLLCVFVFAFVFVFVVFSIGSLDIALVVLELTV